LFEILQDEDPKVVCQAIRVLLVYDDDILVERKLKLLLNHENEKVKTVFSLVHEVFAKSAISRATLARGKSDNKTTKGILTSFQKDSSNQKLCQI